MPTDFEVYFWNKPFSETLNSLATCARSMDFDTETGQFRKAQTFADYRQFEYPKPDGLTSLALFDQTRGRHREEVDSFTMRLIEVKGCPDVSVFQSVTKLDSFFLGDEVGAAIGALRYHFKYTEFEGTPF